VAEALQQGGHEIVYVTCGRQLRRVLCGDERAQCVASRVGSHQADHMRKLRCSQGHPARAVWFIGLRFVWLISQEEESRVEEILGA